LTLHRQLLPDRATHLATALPAISLVQSDHEHHLRWAASPRPYLARVHPVENSQSIFATSLTTALLALATDASAHRRWPPPPSSVAIRAVHLHRRLCLDLYHQLLAQATGQWNWAAPFTGRHFFNEGLIIAGQGSSISGRAAASRRFPWVHRSSPTQRPTLATTRTRYNRIFPFRRLPHRRPPVPVSLFPFDAPIKSRWARGCSSSTFPTVSSLRLAGFGWPRRRVPWGKFPPFPLPLKPKGRGGPNRFFVGWAKVPVEAAHMNSCLSVFPINLIQSSIQI
jgi:hypothetical protein